MSELDPSQRAHALLGASSMSRWEACPGSLRHLDLFPEKESAFAAEGTLAHKIAEDCLELRMDAEKWPALFAPSTLSPLPDDMLNAVQVYLDAVLDEVGSTGNAELEIEQLFSLEAVSGIPDMFGTNDASVYHPDSKKLVILDYKHGVGIPVEVADNPQLFYYALGAAARKQNRGTETVELVVVQPRCDHPDGPVRRATYDAMALLEFRDRLITAAERTEDPDAPLNPGKHCRFCPKAGACKVYAFFVFEMLESFGWRINKETGAMASPEEENYSKDQIAALYEQKPMIQAFFKRVEEQAERKAKDGDLPGFKYVSGRRSHFYKNEGEAEKVLRRAGCKPDEIRPPEMLSVAKAKELLKKVDKSRMDEFNAHVATKKGKPVLVPESDRRPAIPVGAEADFDVIN